MILSCRHTRFRFSLSKRLVCFLLLSLAVHSAFGGLDETLIVELPVPAIKNRIALQEPFYLSSGIPLAKAVAKDVDQLQIRDSKGKPVSSQITALAFWDDGSIKWAGLSPVIDKDVALPLQLHKTPAEKPESHLSLARTRSGAIISNGIIQVTIENGLLKIADPTSGKVTEVTLELQKITRPAQKVRSGWLAPRKDVAGLPQQRYATEYDKRATLEIEENGPVRVVARVKGRFTAKDGKQTFNRYDYRVYVYEGSAIVRWQPSWIFDGEPTTDSIGGIEAVVRNAVAEGSVPVAGIVAEGGEPDEIKVTSLLVQENATNLRNESGPVAGRLAGWISTAGKQTSSGVSIAVRDFWQNYPSGFEIDGRDVRVGLWPGCSRSILDLTRTSDGTGDGETAEDFEADAVGVGKTFDLLLSTQSSVHSFADIAAMFDKEPLFYPGSRYMTGTHALGQIAYEDHEAFPRIEGFYRALVHWLLANRERFDWRGFINFGDVRTNMRAWKSWKDKGRYGWRNGAADVSRAILTHYFRTGDPVAWQLGAPYARHILDIDTVHHERKKGDAQAIGSMHRRGQDHWSGVTRRSEYTYTQGPFLYHYLSGDMRARSVLLEEVAVWQALPEQVWSVNAADTTLRAWEATGDQEWLRIARQQMKPHLTPDAYRNFRFASDYVSALIQYVDLTGEPEAAATLRSKAEWLHEPTNWAYFSPHLGRRSTRLMLAAYKFHETKNVTQWLKYPAYILADALPPLAPDHKDWDWETLANYVRQIPPGLDLTTLLASEFGFGPYFLGALQKADWDENKLLSLPRLHGNQGVGFRICGTVSDLGQNSPVFTDCGWRFLPLPATPDPAIETLKPLVKSLGGLPAGALLEVNHVPFQIPATSLPHHEQLLLLRDGKSVGIEIPAGASGVHLLGPMLIQGDWREGESVIEYHLHLRDGRVLTGSWKNLTDMDDYRGFHYPSTTQPGRFWQLGTLSRVHLDTFQIDFKKEDVQRLELHDTGKGYVSFLLAATAQMPATDKPEVLAEVVFNQPAQGETASNEQKSFIFNKNTTSPQTETGAGWLLSDYEIAALRFSGTHVGSDSTIALQIPMIDGEYLVEINLRASTNLGNVIQVDTSGNSLAPFSISGAKGDRICLPAKVSNGKLELRVMSLPSLHSDRQQSAHWELLGMRVLPLPPGRWRFTPPRPFVPIAGAPLGRNASYTQTVGKPNNYSFWGMEHLSTDKGVYRVQHPHYPQDIVLNFKAPITLSGVLFVPFLGQGPNDLALEVKNKPTGAWKRLKSWKLDEGSVAIREPVEPQQVYAVRFLMLRGDGTTLSILRADVFGEKTTNK